jgi:hypothetical protein
MEKALWEAVMTETINNLIACAFFLGMLSLCTGLALYQKQNSRLFDFKLE